MQQGEALIGATELQNMACHMSGHCLSLDWGTKWVQTLEGRVCRQAHSNHDIG